MRAVIRDAGGRAADLTYAPVRRARRPASRARLPARLAAPGSSFGADVLSIVLTAALSTSRRPVKSRARASPRLTVLRRKPQQYTISVGGITEKCGGRVLNSWPGRSVIR